MQDPRQPKRWPEIEAVARVFVKPAPSDPSDTFDPHRAFPILAIAPTARHAGIVCLDERLRPIRARTLRLRDRQGDEGKRVAVLDALDDELELLSPRVVVLSAGASVNEVGGVITAGEYALGRARDSGAHVVILRVLDAFKRAAGVESARDAALPLMERYIPLRKRLAPCGTPLLRHERFRETKPLLMAFALAHAVALDALSRSAHSHSSGPPHEQQFYANPFP